LRRGFVDPSVMVYFTGTVKVVVCEASDLKPTDFSTRLQACLLIKQYSNVSFSFLKF